MATTALDDVELATVRPKESAILRRLMDEARFEQPDRGKTEGRDAEKRNRRAVSRLFSHD